MANFYDYWFLSLEYLSSILLLSITFAVFRNFLKKKTTGTLFLFTAYFLIGLSNLIGAIQKTFQVVGTYSLATQYAIMIGTIFPIIGSVFIYAFSCRGIITDSEYLRTITYVISSFVVGVCTMLYVAAINFDLPSFFEWDDSGKYSPNIRTASIGFVSVIAILFQLYFYIRIIVNSFILAKNSEEITRKRGFQFIAWGLLLFLFAGLLTGPLAVVELPESVNLIFQTIRRLIFYASYIMLYIGWTLPAWFRRRIRRKSWFEVKYTAA